MVIFVRINLLMGILVVISNSPLLSEYSTFSKELNHKGMDDNYIQQMLVGLLLSDGTLVKKYVGGNAYFQMAQSIIFLSYITWVHSFFFNSGLSNMPKPTAKTTMIKGKKYVYYSFYSKSLPLFNSLFKEWYSRNESNTRNIKRVPENIGDILTPIGLAHWLIGDGGWTGKGIHLATHNFTVEDNLVLMSVLQNKFGIECSMHSQNRIYLPINSALKFTELVRPHMHSSMLYKIDKSFTRPVLDQ
jgi:LAGLIDADG DNA endonuclease family